MRAGVHTDAGKGAVEWAVWNVGYTSESGNIWVAAVLLRQGGGPRSSHGADELRGFEGTVLGISTDRSMAPMDLHDSKRGSQLTDKILFFEQSFH